MKSNNLVMFVVDNIVIGGAEKYVADLSNILPKHSYNTLVCAVSRIHQEAIERFSFDPSKVIHLNLSRLTSIHSIPAILRLSRILKDKGVTLVHTNLTSSDFVGGIAALLSGIPFVVTQHDTLPWRLSNALSKRLLKLMHRLLMKHAQAVICVSSSVKDYLIETEKVPRDKIHVVRHGINLNAFRKKRPTTIKDVGILARITEAKGHIFVLRALPKVLKHKRIRILIAGDGNYKDYLVQESHRLGVSDHVAFLGNVVDIPGFFDKIDALLYPVLYGEGLGYAILEGMAAAKLIIATDCDGIPEIVKHGQTGIIVRSGSTEEIEAALVKVTEDPHFAVALAENAYQFALDNLSIENMARNTIAIYDSIADA